MSGNSLLKHRPFIYVALICYDNASPVSLLPLFREQTFELEIFINLGFITEGLQ